MRRLVCLCLVAALAACGQLPQPLLGHPGVLGARLAEPPPARLAVPGAAGLPPAAAAAFAEALAAALDHHDVPALAGPAHPGDWRLVASLAGDGLAGDGAMLTPRFSILDPAGHVRAKRTGTPAPAALWQAGDRTTLIAAAAAAAPGLASDLLGIAARQALSDPASLLNRPARVALAGVVGAPGDGDVSLAQQFAAAMARLGLPLDAHAKEADYIVHATVLVTPAGPGQQRVEIHWHVADTGGRQRGDVAQLNDVPAGTLDHYWGDVAAVVANQAASGVKEVVASQARALRAAAKTK